MACFLAPTAEAIATTAIKKVIEKKGIAQENSTGVVTLNRISKKLGVLNKMLWGGSALLLVEHIFHGEVTFAFPFFTALGTTEGTLGMLKEIGTVGCSMCLLVTSVWAAWAVISTKIENNKEMSKVKN